VGLAEEFTRRAEKDLWRVFKELHRSPRGEAMHLPVVSGLIYLAVRL